MTGLLKKIGVLALPLSLTIPGISQAVSLQNADTFWTSPGYSTSTVSAMPWWESNTITSFGYQSLTSDARYGWDAAANANIGYSKKSTEGEATLRFYATSDQYLDYYAR